MRRVRLGGRGRNTRLLRFTMSYLSLLLVIVLLGGSMFAMAVGVVAGQTADINAMMLEQAAVRLESSLSEADSFTYTVNRLGTLRKLMLTTRPFSSEESYGIREATGSLASFEDSGALFAGYQVYLSGGDFILEPGNCCLNIDLLYNRAFGYGDLTVEAWRAQVLDTASGAKLYPAQSALVGRKSGNMLLYVRSLTYLFQQAGKAIFYLDEARLQALFAPLTELSAGCVLLMSREGEVLSASAKLPAGFSLLELAALAADSGSYAVSGGDGRALVFYKRLASSGCMIAAITPYSMIIRQTSAVLKPMLVGVALLVFAGLALTLYSIHTNRKPLVKTLELLSSGDNNLARRGLSQLDQAVHQLVSSNNLLAKRLEEQRMELRTAIAASLESGDTLDDGELDMLLSHVSVQPEGDRFRGVYLVLHGETELDTDELERGDMRRALVMELLAPYAPRVSFLALRSLTCFMLLYAETDGEKEDLHAFFGALYNACRSVENLEPSFYVGTECSRLCYLPHSLLAARQLMLREEKSAFLSVAQPGQFFSETYFYTEQHDKKLVSLASLGKEDALYALLDELYAENARRNLSRLHCQMLFFRMVGTLSGMLDAADLPEELTFSPHKLAMDQFFSLIRQSYALVCRQSRERRTAHTEKLLTDMLTYLQENCADCMLSLSSTAMHFGITEKYLSAFIHEKAAINFSSYVEQLRIRRADELLTQTDLTIEEIAQRVGYANVKTFRRAYGRAVGVAPSETRRMRAAQAGKA